MLKNTKGLGRAVWYQGEGARLIEVDIYFFLFLRTRRHGLKTLVHPNLIWSGWLKTPSALSLFLSLSLALTLAHSLSLSLILYPGIAQ